MANNLKFTTIGNTQGWYTCGCGGTPKTFHKAKSEAEIIFTNVPATGKDLIGENGAKYRARLGLIALDVVSADANSFVSQGIARFATDQDRAGYSGADIRTS